MKVSAAIALLKGAKAAGETALTFAYHGVQRLPQLSGLLKTYQPRDEEGEQLPSEGTRLQKTVSEIMRESIAPLSRLLDLTATVDKGNQEAMANVVVGDKTILTDVPVSTLLYLEKKLSVFSQLVDKLPVLDAAEEWIAGDDGLSYKTEPAKSVRTKKVPRVLEKAPATDKHPAQVEVWYEDVVVGTWSKTTFSGAISQKQKRVLANKVAQLQEAVKVARENANSLEIRDVKIADPIFDFLGWATITAE